MSTNWLGKLQFQKKKTIDNQMIDIQLLLLQKVFYVKLHNYVCLEYVLYRKLYATPPHLSALWKGCALLLRNVMSRLWTDFLMAFKFRYFNTASLVNV